jgi:hypothetical protein
MRRLYPAAVAAAPTALAIDPKTGVMRAAGDPLSRRHAGGF